MRVGQALTLSAPTPSVPSCFHLSAQSFCSSVQAQERQKGSKYRGFSRNGDSKILWGDLRMGKFNL